MQHISLLVVGAKQKHAPNKSCFITVKVHVQQACHKADVNLVSLLIGGEIKLKTLAFLYFINKNIIFENKT